MRRQITLFAVLGLLAFSCQAAMVWQPAPPGATAQQAGGHAGHAGHRGGKPFLLRDGEGAAAEMWLPDLERRHLHLNPGARASVGGTGVDNYHLLFARRQAGERVDVALRYHYQHGKPSGESPSRLISAEKSLLEIVPAPLTREHQRYLSHKVFHFRVRFQGQPLAEQAVMLTTSNGSEIQGRTDREGRLALKLPDDFASVKPGRSNNRPAEFVLTTSHADSGRQYQTTLSAPYYVNPSHWRTTTGGLMAMFAGVLTGFVVLRRSRGSNSKTGRA